MNVRIEQGLPRGGLGYAGTLPAVASIATAILIGFPLNAYLTTALAILAVWLGLGLRQDGKAGEKIDVIVFEDEQELFETDWNVRDYIFRVSTLVMVGGIGGAILSFILSFVGE